MNILKINITVMKKTHYFVLFLLALSCQNLHSQGLESALTQGRISGNFQLEAQTYTQDSLINAPEAKERVLSNGFFNLNYNAGTFSAGLRYEAYQNPILGLDPQYKGSGIAYRFADYNGEFIQVTAGDFYEQFGSGMIFRAYEERALGLDNAMDGFRIKLRPTNSIELTALIGKQRFFWGKGDGLVRGGDMNIELNQALSLELPFNIKIGGSVISKYQYDSDPFLRLPQNVFAYSTRASLSGTSFLFDVEYGQKYNDPNASNLNSYNKGYGLMLSGSYFERGFSVAVAAHKLDNMDFRSDRTATGNNLMLSYIPPINKQNTYKLPNIYPYSTKLNGEVGLQTDVNYVFQPKSLFGGKYGTSLNFNYSRIHSIDTLHLNEYKYKSDFLSVGDRLYYEDLSLSVSKKLHSNFKGALTFMHITYDTDILDNEGAAKFGNTNGNIIILEGTYKFNAKNALRMELQNLWAKQDSSYFIKDKQNGDWALALLEYSYSPHWFVTISDDYNYGNEFEAKRLHYYNLSLTYIESASRIQLSWGRQKQGVICVGGVCRQVPASNGLYLSVSTSF